MAQHYSPPPYDDPESPYQLFCTSAPLELRLALIEGVRPYGLGHKSGSRVELRYFIRFTNTTVSSDTAGAFTLL